MKGANVMKLSIVIPVYFNHDNLLPLYNDLREKVLCKLDCDYEILMVDDGSKINPMMSSASLPAWIHILSH